MVFSKKNKKHIDWTYDNIGQKHMIVSMDMKKTKQKFLDHNLQLQVSFDHR